MAEGLQDRRAQPDIRISEIADVVGITERAAHRILMDLVEEGYLSVGKVGRETTTQSSGAYR